jgi:hypothetical protein
MNTDRPNRLRQTAPRAGRAGPPRAPAAPDRPASLAREHDPTHLRGAKVGQIPPNPPIQGGFVRQSPLSDTNPAHPSKSTGVS